MSIPDELRNIRDHLRSGHFGQREVWERQLENAAVEFERLLALSVNNANSWDAIVRERDDYKEQIATLRELRELESK